MERMRADDSPIEMQERTQRTRTETSVSDSTPRSRMIRLPGEVLQIQMPS